MDLGCKGLTLAFDDLGKFEFHCSNTSFKRFLPSVCVLVEQGTALTAARYIQNVFASNKNELIYTTVALDV